jgi:Fe-S cluster biogenesis protein NfuA
MELRQQGISWDQVQLVLDEIRPAMRKDGGDCDLVEVTTDGVIKLRLIGACGKCPLSFMTLTMGIETRLKASIPAVSKVISIEDTNRSSDKSSSPGLLKIGKTNK